MQSIDSTSSSTLPVTTEHNITGIHVLATTAPPPPNASSIRRSASASVLGESRNATNVQSRPSTSQSGGNRKGKATSESRTVRVVSAPSQPHNIPAPRAISSRSTSQPISRQPRPSSSMAHLPAIQDEEEEEDFATTPQEPRHSAEQSIDLTWALRGGLPAQRVPQSQLDPNSAEELRREISNLQLDMLRMARGLKVCPLDLKIHARC